MLWRFRDDCAAAAVGTTERYVFLRNKLLSSAVKGLPGIPEGNTIRSDNRYESRIIIRWSGGDSFGPPLVVPCELVFAEYDGH